VQAGLNPDQILELRVPAKPDRLCVVRALVRVAVQTAGCSEQVCEKLVIAVNEACMNVIQHAYKDGESGEIVLEILNNGVQLLFRLTDFAAPVDLEAIVPRDLEDVRPGGLGVHFIREIMDGVEMGHLEGTTGNYIEMIKRIN
jgi:sigma-B regulation protein RsbU (phosphoserine phosphatase)